MSFSVITAWKTVQNLSYIIKSPVFKPLHSTITSPFFNPRPVAHCRACHQLANSIGYENKYSEKEQNLLLEFFNTASEEELVKFNVSRARAQKLCRYVRRKGKFGSVYEVLEVDGFGIRVLERMCNSILYPDSDDSADGTFVSTKRHVKVVAPSFTEEQRQELKSAVGLYLTPSSLSWARLDRFGNLSEWDTCSIQMGGCKKQNHATLFETVYDMRSQLPSACAYVIEGNQSMLPQPAFVSLHIQKAQVQAMFIALLNNNYAVLQRHSVFELKPTCTSRLFGLRVGTERVSGQSVVNDMLQGLACAYPYTRVEVADDVRNRFESEEPPTREALSQALLITMTFFDLVVHRKPHSLKLISK